MPPEPATDPVEGSNVAVDGGNRAGAGDRPRDGRGAVQEAMAVLVGGALGGGARLGVAAAVPAADGIPIGTLLANVTGALLLGYLLARLHGRPDTGLIRPLLATGLLGGYTTFSTFALETWELVEAGRATAGAGYAVLSLTLGVAAAAVGVAAARQRA